MSIATETKQWITGEEYAREWRRLRAAGYRSASPEYQALMRRVDERNQHLWVTYGLPLIERYPGQWIAISTDGQVIIGEADLTVSEEAEHRFGAGNYYTARLDETRGAHRIGPRSG